MWFLLLETKAMPKIFRRGDHVEWNSEAGRVRGVIIKKVVSDLRIKGYVHHASTDEPQYLIQIDKTDHVAIHKGKALRHIRAKAKKKSTRGKMKG
jgi:Hypervirulence associated proteins TUDOR domain